MTLRVVAHAEPVLSSPPCDWDQGPSEPESFRDIGVEGRTVKCRIVSRASLAPGDEVHGPALVEQPDTTTLLSEDDLAMVDESNNLVVHLER